MHGARRARCWRRRGLRSPATSWSTRSPRRSRRARAGSCLRARCARTAPSSPSRADSSCGSPAAARCCRRSTSRGAPGHAGIAPRHHAAGGAVNAIEKASYLRRGRSAPARGVGAAAAPSVPVAARLRADHDPGWRVAGLLPGALPHRLPHRVPARARRTSAAGAPRCARSSRTGSRAPRRPTRGCASTRRSVEWLVGEVPPAEVPADDPVVIALLGRAAGARPRGGARRARQLARRRDARRRGRHSRRLLRAGRRPPRAHGRRVGADRRPRRLHRGHRGRRHALLRPQPNVKA